MRLMTTITHSRSIRSDLDRMGLGSKTFLIGDFGWDGARQAWNLAVDQQPAAVVFSESIEEVVAAVHVARGHGLRVIAQGTGHGAASYGDLDDTMLIRTSRMRSIDIHEGACTVQAGTLWGEVAYDLAGSGMTPLSGSSPDVGVVGYTLGGGIGWLSRRYGLACNAVRSVDLVTADGRLRRVDHDQDPELFWAMRGGGAGFGVVTGIEFDLMPVSHVYGGTLAWDAVDAPRLFAAWSEWTADLDESITSIMRFLSLPPIPEVPEPFRGRRVVTLGAVGVGDPSVVENHIARLRTVAAPVLDTFGVMPCSELVRLHGDPEGPTPGVSHHTLLSELSGDVIARLVERVGVDSGSPLISAEIRHLGGALARHASHGGVLSRITAPYALMGVGMAADPEMKAASETALTHLIDAVAPWNAGSYLNFAERNSDAVFDVEAAAQLAAVKARIDPDGLFRLRTNQNFAGNVAGEEHR